MKLFCDFDEYNWTNVTVTTGMFDGVHAGHKELIQFVVEQAKKKGQKSVLVTFKPHPRYIVNPNDPFKLLSTYNERVQLLSETGLDGMMVIPFNATTANMAHMDFISEVLVKKIGIAQYVLGYDHRFGKNREGSFSEVLALGEKYGFTVQKFKAIEKGDQPVSSTRVREMLLMGDMLGAKQLLGYTYGITGTVVKGVQIGRTLGFPTANIEPEDPHKLIPGMGVYAVKVFVGHKMYKGMLNIGIRPTVNSNAEFPTIEVHIIDFEGNLYGKELTVKFVSKIRDEMKFDGLPALSAQLKRDKKAVLNYL